jgi:glycerol-3-phosphate dehydrogenase (NAD(P)+)
MPSSKRARIGIVGAGAWGTALAAVAARAGADTLVWAREPEVVAAINNAHENSVFLAGIVLLPEIRATNDLGDLGDRDVLLVVTPAQALRPVLADLAPHVRDGTPLVICSKGIERGTSKLMSMVLAETIPGAAGYILSGPSFAADVARGLPTAVTLAGPDEASALPIAEMLSIPAFRPYVSGDIIGAQVGGAVKNVLAIACGIVDGRALGASARAALTTRGFAELSRFGSRLGARPETLAGLSGLGDLILTCNSPQSRNMSLGIELGRGRTVDEVLGSRNSVSEGVYTAAVVVDMARGLGVEMPICDAVHEIVEGRLDVDGAMERLLARPIRAES